MLFFNISYPFNSEKELYFFLANLQPLSRMHYQQKNPMDGKYAKYNSST